MLQDTTLAKVEKLKLEVNKNDNITKVLERLKPDSVEAYSEKMKKHTRDMVGHNQELPYEYHRFFWLLRKLVIWSLR